VQGKHPSRRSVGQRTALVVAALCGVTGCADASRMFTGMWRAEAPLETAWISGRPELAIGHFGPELTGVVRFLDDDGFPTASCPCAFLDQQDVDLDARRFVATTELCDGDTRWIWQLTLDDDGADPRLVGDVRRAADEGTPPVAVSFRLDDEFVPDDRRECAP
jgi:hypothetical protein